MKKVGTRKLKNCLGKYIDRAQAGESTLITRRGKAVAQLNPVAPEGTSGKSVDEILQELAAAGHIRLATRPLAPFKPVKAKGKPASQMIIEDRR